MKKLPHLFSFIFIICLLCYACQKNQISNDLSGVSIFAPNGLQISSSIEELEQLISTSFLSNEDKGVEVQICDIKYTFWDKNGYFSVIDYTYKNGLMKGSFAVSFNLNNIYDSKGNTVTQLKSEQNIYFFCIPAGSCEECVIQGIYDPVEGTHTVSCSCADCILEVQIE